MSRNSCIAGMPDASVIRVDALPETLPSARPAGLYAHAAAGVLLCGVPGVGRFQIRDGIKVEIAIEKDVDPRTVELFLDGIVRAALIYQRGEMPLNAACLAAPDSGRAVAICGGSGLGKSTLAAELCRQGWRLLADGNARIVPDGERVLAWPGAAALKLWRDACEANALDPAALECVRPGIEKYLYPVRAETTPSALAAIVALTMAGDPDLREVGGAARFALISENGYRPRLVDALGCTASHFDIVSKIAKSARIFRLGGARAAPVWELAGKIAAALP